MSNLVSNNWWADDEKIKLLQQTYAKDLKGKQFEIFLHLASNYGLDPFKKEIYPTVVSGRLVTLVGIDGFRKIAHSGGDYAGCDPIEVSYHEDGSIDKATCTVYKMIQGQRCPFTATVAFSEFNTRKNRWKDMPLQMIQKVAESHALRKAFTVMSNVYTPEEMEGTERDVTVIDEQTNKLIEEMLNPKQVEYQDERN